MMEKIHARVDTENEANMDKFRAGNRSYGSEYIEDSVLAGMDPTGPEFVHTVVECAKLGFADREAWYGDPDFVDVPLEALLSPSYSDERRSLIDSTASGELRPGAVDGRVPRLLAGVPAVAPAPGVGEPTMASGASLSGDTCHLDVADSQGNLVSATPSGGWLHGSPSIPELGFCLGTRAQMFWLEEGLPNSLEPRKRPRTTLSPKTVSTRPDARIQIGAAFAPPRRWRPAPRQARRAVVQRRIAAGEAPVSRRKGGAYRNARSAGKRPVADLFR